MNAAIAKLNLSFSSLQKGFANLGKGGMLGGGGATQFNYIKAAFANAAYQASRDFAAAFNEMHATGRSVFERLARTVVATLGAGITSAVRIGVASLQTLVTAAAVVGIKAGGMLTRGIMRGLLGLRSVLSGMAAPMIKVVTDVLYYFGVGLGKVARQVIALGQVFVRAAGTFASVFANVASLIAGGLITTVGRAIRTVGRLFIALSGVAGVVLYGVLSALHAGLTLAAKAVAGIGKALLRGLLAVYKVISGIVAAVGNVMLKVVGVVTSIVKSIAGTIVKVLGEAFKVVGQVAGVVFGAIGLAAAAALGGIAYGLYKSVQSASDLGESMNKTGVIFGDAAKTVVDYADEMAKKYGIVKTEVLDAAGNFGKMLQSVGKTRQESADLSKQLVQMGLDMASLYNVSVTDALTALRAGLSGEAEPLKRYGVLLDETQVKLEALRMGLFDGSRELSVQEKTQARLGLITKGLAVANGDLANTFQSLPNQVKAFWGNLENLRATIGAKLIPAATRLMQALNGLIGRLQANVEGGGLDGFLGKVVGAIDLATFAIENLGGIWNLLVEGFSVGMQFLGNLWTWLSTNVAAVVKGMTEVFGTLMQIPGFLIQSFQAFGTFFGSLFGGVANFIGGILKSIMGGFTSFFEWLMGGFQGVGSFIGDVFGSIFQWISDQLKKLGIDIPAAVSKLTTDLKAALPKAPDLGNLGFNFAMPEGPDMSGLNKAWDDLANKWKDFKGTELGGPPELGQAQDQAKDKPLEMKPEIQDQEQRKSEVINIADFANKLQSSIGGKDKVQERQLEEQKKTNEGINKLIEMSGQQNAMMA